MASVSTREEPDTSSPNLPPKSLTTAMAALGQKETSSDLVSDVRFGAVSGPRSRGF